MPCGLVAMSRVSERKKVNSNCRGLLSQSVKQGAGVRGNALNKLVVAARLPREKNALSLLTLHRQEMTAAAALGRAITNQTPPAQQYTVG